MKRIKKPRTTFFINRQVQLDVIMHVMIFVSGLFLTQLICAVLFVLRIESLIGVDALQELSAMEFLNRYKYFFAVTQVIPLVIFIILGIFYFGRMTQKIVGPLFNIQRVLRTMNNEGREKLEIKLREDDYFQELAQQINVLIASKK